MIKPTNASPAHPAASETTRDEKRLKETCKEFESVLTGFLLKSMRESIIKAEEADQARSTFEGMMDETLSKEFSQSSGIGLGEVLYRELAPLLRAKPADAHARVAMAQQKTQDPGETAPTNPPVQNADGSERTDP